MHQSTLQCSSLQVSLSLPFSLLPCPHPLCPLALNPPLFSFSLTLPTFGFSFFIYFFSLFFFIAFFTTHKTKLKNMSPFLYKVVFSSGAFFFPYAPTFSGSYLCGAPRFCFTSSASVGHNIKWILRLLGPLRSLGIVNLVDKSTVQIFPQKLLHNFSFMPKSRTKNQASESNSSLIGECASTEPTPWDLSHFIT